jgi:tRNA pseudouridine38-40 synthase
MRLAFRLSYDGNQFRGSQLQPAYRTVEGELITACQRVQLFDDPGRAGFALAGRTDRGVHARGQVGAFSTPFPERAVEALNGQLSPDLWCNGFAEVPPSFHPRFDAISRTYRYFFADWPLDIGAMDQAAAVLVGTHDFSRLARVREKSPIRTVKSARVFLDRGIPVFEVTAHTYLWHMVRCMAAALLSIGTHEREPELMERLLSGECRRNPPAAPADGLVLWDIDCGVTFTPTEPDPRSRDWIGSARRQAIVRERIISLLDRGGVDRRGEEPVDDSGRDLL